MSYTGMIDTMWLSLFGGNQLGAALALLVVFSTLCYARRLEPHQAFFVALPVVVGLGTALPDTVKIVLFAGAGIVFAHGVYRLIKV